MSGPFSDILLGKASIPPSPTRRRILLSFARADGQTWTEDQAESGWTDHMAEQMYGVEADIVFRERSLALGDALIDLDAGLVAETEANREAGLHGLRAWLLRRADEEMREMSS